MSRYFQPKNTGQGPNMKKPTLKPKTENSNVTKPMQFKKPNENNNKNTDTAKPVEGITAAVVTSGKPEEKKFTQRSRLFCGNLPIEINQDEFKKIFEKYGEVSEVFLNKDKGYGFVRLDTRANAEKAKWELDGIQLKNRTIRVRYATHGAALSIKNLSPFVTNELLESAFSQFGPIERAVVITDERGKSTEKGIVEFARKASATKALQRIKDDVFLLTSSPRAIAAVPLEQEDSEDGLSEKLVNQSPQYFQEREGQPRFAQPGTFEHEFGLRWKALDEMERQQREQLDKTIANAKAKLEAEMEDAIHDHKTMMMKQDLMRRQEELQRLEDARRREMDRRKQLELAREDAEKKEIEKLVQQQEILRAQVEGHRSFGNSQQQNIPTIRNMQSRNDNDFRLGPTGQGASPAEHFFKDQIAQELMAGGPPPNMNRPPPPFEDFPPPIPNQGRRSFNQGKGGYNGQGQQRRPYGNNSTGFDNGGQKRRRY